MTKTEVRLEVLKLTYTHSRDAAEAVARARKLEEYIFETQDVASEMNVKEPLKKASRVQKNSGNSNLFE